MLYCLAFYLLGASGENAYFGWAGYARAHNKDGSHGYYSEFDVSLGSPINDYYLLASVHSRDFEKGKVLVNPATSPFTVSLDGEYKTLIGQAVSNVTLEPHSGIILLKP